MQDTFQADELHELDVIACREEEPALELLAVDDDACVGGATESYICSAELKLWVQGRCGHRPP